MQIKSPTSIARIFFAAISISILLSYSSVALAWGSDGHTTVGILAVDQLRPEALRELENVLNPLTKQVMEEACNWPDAIRETEKWAWSAPLHYVNIPRGEEHYTESRDCPRHDDHVNHPERPPQYCVTEGIKYYANELADRQASREMRGQAFAWLCHLVGDLHQPLHAGFADDRGGNDFEIIFKKDRINLHGFWDFELINEYAGSWQHLVGALSPFPALKADSDWSPEMVNDWTTESHRLALQKAYPDTKKIDEFYQQRSWELAQEQIISAASRLALIINTKLGISE